MHDMGVDLPTDSGVDLVDEPDQPLPDMQVDAEMCEGCEIDGQCLPEGTISSENECLVCESVASIQDFTPVAAGTACGSGGVCQDGDCVCPEGLTGSDCDVCTVFVSASSDATDPDGLGWSTAFADLQDGLALAQDRAVAGSPCEVWVSSGTYVPGTERSDTFLVPRFVHLYGGFVGTETDREQRDPDAPASILDGENSSFSVATLGENHNHILDGFTIRGGRANEDLDPGTVNPGNRGGGIYARFGSTTFRNLIVEHNGAGSAVTSGFGAGLYMTSRSSDVNRFENVRFQRNQATHGGGIYINTSGSNGGEYYFYQVVFQDNEGTTNGSAMDFTAQPIVETPPTRLRFDGLEVISNRGSSGLYLQGVNSELTNARFAGNSPRSGGVLVNEQGVMVVADAEFVNNTCMLDALDSCTTFSANRGPTTLRDVRFTNNGAPNLGGALTVQNAEVEIVDGHFEGNSSNGRGGAINSGSPFMDFAPASLVLRNVVFADNSSDAWGGAVKIRNTEAFFVNTLFYDNTAGAGGGAIYNRSSDLSIVNATFARNKATTHPGGAVVADVNWLAEQTIFWGNLVDLTPNQVGGGGTAQILYSLIEGGSPGEGNISDDPLFVDEAQNDFQLQVGSPAINAGNAATTQGVFPQDGNGTALDLANNPRFVGTIDIGAFEYQ